MKIALVCGHFVPSMGYVEVYYAKELAKLGHDVTVFTSAVVPSYVSKIVTETYQVGETKAEGYNITRLAHKFSVGQMIKAKGLTKAILEFQPELVIAVGLGKLFPEPIFKLSQQFKIITLLGDNANSHEASNKKPLIDNMKQLVKKRVYKKAIVGSHKLFGYTLESIEIVKAFIGGELAKSAEEKHHLSTLGFDHNKFHFSESERNITREKLSIPKNETVLITATRIIKDKQLESIIDHVNSMNEDGKNLKYILIGFLNDSYGNQVKSYIDSKKHSNQFICLPFMSAEEVRAHYNAADFVYFPSPVISIFEALGTGLPAILPNQKSVGHILSERNGFYFDQIPSETLQEAYDKVNSGNFGPREELESHNCSLFSYSVIVQEVLSTSGY